ncbi:hypothetical protein O9361_02645 [Proteus vulgaris]|uniref:hypothetical protein n=1 Tax=Proteus vulgaris TaxID=585 RepID=UPI002578D040|nr:hypothetical protein [Proteus vulgaris]MDM3562525.1 hypothetical protein [Proteus vulgaris]
MNTINNTRQGIERIFFIISVLLIFSITILLLKYFNILGYSRVALPMTLMYLLLYTLAVIIPLSLAQLLLWIIYGFKGIPFQLTVNPKPLAFLISLLSGLSVASLVLNNLLWMFYDNDASVGALLIFVSVVIGIALGIGMYKKIIPVLTQKLNKTH